MTSLNPPVAATPVRISSHAAQLTRADLITALALLVVTALTRLPFTEKILYHWDSINFALSISRFDVAQGQPHVPGYILYVLLARLVNQLTASPERALVLIAVLSSGLAVSALYLLGREMFDRTAGLLAALFLLVSPLFWFYGEIALPHTLDAFMVIFAVWLLYRVRRGDTNLAVPAAIWLALAGGFRPQTQVFLAPLAIYAGWRLGWKRILLALAVMAVVDLAWLIPLLALSGGLSRYMEIMSAFTETFNTTTSQFSGAGAFGLARNLTKLSMYSLYGWGLAVILAAVGFWSVLARARTAGVRSLISRLSKDPRTWFFILWIVPVVAYYTLIHMGQQGLVFVFLPALLLLSAVSLPAAWLRLPAVRLGLAVMLVLSGSIFLFAPANPLGNESLKLLTHQTLTQHDAFYQQRFAALTPEAYPPEHTLILSSEWRFPQYYLPDYAYEPYTIGARWEISEGQPTLGDTLVRDPAEVGVSPDANGSLALILFDPDLLPYLDASGRPVDGIPGVDGLAVVRLRAGDLLELSAAGIQIAVP